MRALLGLAGGAVTTFAPSMQLDHDPRRRLEREAHWFYVGADLLAGLLGVEVRRITSEPDSGGLTLADLCAAAFGGEQ